MQFAELLPEMIDQFRSMVERVGAVEINNVLGEVLDGYQPEGFHDGEAVLPHFGRVFAHDTIHMSDTAFAARLTKATHEIAAGVAALGINEMNAIRLAVPFTIAAAMERGRITRQDRPAAPGGVAVQ